MPAAQRQAGDAGRRNDARWHGQPECVCGVVDIALRAAGTNAGRADGWINAYTLHGGEVDDQAIIYATKSSPVVPTAVERDRKGGVASEIDGSNHVGGVDAAGDD